MRWWTALPTVVATLVVFWGPGMAVLAALGMRGLRLAALAPAVGAGLLGATAAAAGTVGMPWNPWTAVGLTVVAATAGACRDRFRRRATRHDDPGAAGAGSRHAGRPERSAGAVSRVNRRHLAVALALAAAAQLVPVAVGMGRPDRVQNAWDALFHLQAVASARAAHRVDPVWVAHLLDPTGETSVYPSGWHALAVLVPAQDPRTAVTVAAVLPCVLALTLGMALLAREIWRSPLPTLLAPLLLATGIATPLSIALQPGLIPNAFALALVPAVLSLVARWWRQGSRPTLSDAVAAGLGILGIGLAHPNAAVGAAVLATPWFVAAGVRAAVPRWRGGRRVSVALTSAAVLLGVSVVIVALLGSPSGRVLAAVEEDPGTPPLELLVSILTGRLGEWAFYPVLPTLLALGACIIVWRPGRAAAQGRFVVAALGLVLGLYLAAASGQPRLSAVTDLWYSEPRRIAPLVGICVTVLAAGALAAAARALADRTATSDRLSRNGAAALVALTLTALVVVPGTQRLADLADDTFSQEVPDDPGFFHRVPYLSADEEAMIERLRGVLDPDALLLGSSFSGPGHLAALTGQRVVQPYHASALDDTASYVSAHLADLSVDPLVCAQVRALGARYVWVDPYPLHSTYWTFAMIGDFTEHPTGLEPLDTAGTTAVYDLGRCYR